MASLRAARRVGLRIEIEDEVAAFEILQRDLAAAVARQGEGRRLRTRNQVRAPYAFLSSFSTRQCRTCHLRRVGATGSIIWAVGRAGSASGRPERCVGARRGAPNQTNDGQRAPSRRIAPHAVAAGRALASRRVRMPRWPALERRCVRALGGLALGCSMRRLFWSRRRRFSYARSALLGLWWRLSSGPIELDVATPWLKAAIEENFGGKHTVTVGGTQIERDEKGRTSLRLLDIVVRDADGTVVASAPKAEVGLSGIEPVVAARCARKASIWSARKCRCASKPTAA